MEIQVREFLEADRERLRELYVAARDAAFVWDPPGAHRPEDFDIATAGERILVACGRARPVGFASIWEPDSFLHCLFVHPLYQGRGVGTALLAECRRYFRSGATLKCLTSNRAALRFYESRGWHVRAEGDDPGGPYYLLAEAP